MVRTEDAALTRQSARVIRAALGRADLTAVEAEARRLTPAQTVDVMERLPTAAQRAVLYRLLPKAQATAVFEELDPPVQKKLIASLRAEEVAAAFADLDPDDRVALLDELPAEVANRLLRGLSAEQRELTFGILGYPKKAVGHRMSPATIRLDRELSAGAALAKVRDLLDVAETVYALPVTDPDRVLVGTVSLRDLLAAPETARVGDIMTRAPSARAGEPAKDAARRCAKRRLLALPVVDNDTRLVGILTLDDALRIIEEADSEDQAHLSGTERLRQPYLTTGVGTLVRARVVWLLVLGIGAALTVRVLDVFEATLEQEVTLALFVPLLIGTGGNTGNQAATTVTRALALRDVAPNDVARVMAREFRVGVSLGVILGSLGFLFTALFFGRPIGLIIGLTLLSVCTMAATVGGMMPLLAKAVRADPAVFSNPFITTFVDATGLVIYFLIARAILPI